VFFRGWTATVADPLNEVPLLAIFSLASSAGKMVTDVEKCFEFGRRDFCGIWFAGGCGLVSVAGALGSRFAEDELARKREPEWFEK
jgi:hypothetical protein